MSAIVVIVAIWFVLWLVYRRIGILSKPYRVKVITDDNQYVVAVVRRLCTGSYRSDRVLVANLLPNTPDFAKQLDTAIAAARTQAEELTKASRIARRSI